MKKVLKTQLLASTFIVLTSCGERSISDSGVANFENEYTKTMVDSIYNSLNDKERTAQLCGIRSSDLIGADGKLSIELCKEKIPYGIGHICQFACSLDMTPEELKTFVDDLQKYLINNTNSKIPAIFHEEAISGFAAKGATIYPQQLGVACTWNPELAALKTEQTAETMRMIGSTLALSPMSDVIRTPHFNRIEESYGEDAFLTSRMTLAFVQGLQAKGLENGVAACTKHFLGYGGGSNATHKELIEEILMPHEVAITKGGSKVVMTGYHSYKGIKTVANDTLIQNVLKDYLEFDGLVVSDYGAVTYDCNNADKELLKSRAADAITAGNDIEFSHGVSYSYLPELLAEGKVSRERFEEAVKKALTLKIRSGLFDNILSNSDSTLNLDRDEYRKTSYDLACQSVVMLKNNGILPISSSEKKIALVGPNANTFWCMLGDYTYQSMQAFWFNGKIDGLNPKIVSLYEALNNKKDSSYKIYYERGCDWSDTGEASIDKSGKGEPRTMRLKMMLMESADPTNWDAAMSVAKQSDVIIAAVGENPTLCGEGRERKGIRLPGEQERFVDELVATGKPVVLVVFGGRPQVLGSLKDKCAAILQAWYPGEEGGNAVADILLGNISPSGKLSVSYPSTEDGGNYCYNYGLNDTLRIAYPFGHGLSYTQFDYSELEMSSTAEIDDKSLSLSFSLQNTGKVSGDEIVQLYISPKSGQNMKPVQLKGFKRVSLKQGEKKNIEFELPLDLFATYENNKWVILPGTYELNIGSSSQDFRLSKKISLNGDKKEMKRRSEYFPKCKCR